MCEANGQKAKGTDTLVVKTNIYCDHCMECSDCSGKLVHDLSFVKGIKTNTLNPKAMTVTITYNTEKISPEKIREAISMLGYDADDVKADATAYSKLDGCCKKPE
jgi:copper chaperone CopZ